MMFRSRQKFWLHSVAALVISVAISPAKLEAKTISSDGTGSVISNNRSQKSIEPKTKPQAKSPASKVSPLDLPAPALAPKSTAKKPKYKYKSSIVNATTDDAPAKGTPKTDGQPVDLNGKTDAKSAVPGNTERDKATPTNATATKANAIQDPINLVIKLGEKQVQVFKGDKLIIKYPIAIGKAGWETPVGEWKVMELIRNPGWTNFKNGEVMAPGPDNPLGERWIGFWSDGKDSIGFHGTSNIKSIGTAASHGCVRMYNKDVRVLFNLVQVGTTVKVVK
jgi:lipoprotein-anchoring transpeptidase ErfK/SrfK